MPTITLNKKELLEKIGRKIGDDKLKHYISYLGTDLDSIQGQDIIVEVFPNRPDLLSEQGFARALATFSGAEKGMRKYSVKKSGEKVIVDKSVKNVRPYTACALVKGLKLNHKKIIELINIQEKLTLTFGRNREKVAIGIYPLEKIKLPIHYKALPPKQIRYKPLEMYDELGADSILEKHPKGKEYGHLLNGLDKYPVFLDDDGKILSMPPIVNSHDVGKVTRKTEDVFIECSGHDLNAQKQALNILVTTMADMGGNIFSMQIVYGKGKETTPNLEPEEMQVKLGYVNEKLGLDLKEKDMKALLEKMGYEYSKGKSKIPAYRTDVLHPIDLVEDIAIAYGYDNFKEEIPKVATISEQHEMSTFTDKVREILAGHGLQEIKNYCLSSERVQNQNMKLELDLVRLANSLSEEYTSLRTWIIPCLLKTLSLNKHNEYPQELFEIGEVFKRSSKADTGVEEAMRAAVLLCGDGPDYTKAKQMIESIFEAFGLSTEYSEDKHPSFIPGRVARVKVKGKGVAYVGELHPETLLNFGIEMPASAFELNITELKKCLK